MLDAVPADDADALASFLEHSREMLYLDDGAEPPRGRRAVAAALRDDAGRLAVALLANSPDDFAALRSAFPAKVAAARFPLPPTVVLCALAACDGGGVASTVAAGPDHDPAEPLVARAAAALSAGDDAVARTIAAELAARCAAKEFSKRTSLQGAAHAAMVAAVLYRDQDALDTAARTVDDVMAAHLSRHLGRWSAGRDTPLDVVDLVDLVGVVVMRPRCGRGACPRTTARDDCSAPSTCAARRSTSSPTP